MATNSGARQARERRLRAKYRKKTIVTAIITLLIGLIIGFVLCAVLVSKPGPISRMLKVGPLDDNMKPIVTGADEDADYGAEEDADFSAEEDANVGAKEDADFSAEEEADFGAEEDADFGAEEDADFGAEEDADFSAEEDFGSDEGAAFGTDEDADAVEAFADEAEGTEDGAPDEGEEAASEPTEEPTQEPTPSPEPTPEPSAAPQIVPYGQPMVIQTEVKSDGSKRVVADDQPFETLNFTLKIDAYKSPTYFQETYSTQYKLNGNEAAVQFDVTLNGYNGALQVIPQDVLTITFMGNTPDVVDEGYQLMDAEIAGKTGIVAAPNTPTTLYKRYAYSAAVGDMKYLVVTTYNNGEPTTYWFDVQAPVPVETPVPEDYVPPEDGGEATDSEGSEASADASTDAAASVNGLTIGSEGEEVSRLQRALIAKGLLQGSPDGKFGNYTADAVKILQARYGMAQTGVADQAFLDRLYSDQ